MIATLHCFGGNNAGSALPMFVMTLIPVLGLVGVLTDYTRATKVRTSLQASLDAALLAGARDGSTNWTNVALDTFNANFQAGDGTVATPSFAIDGNRAYTGTVSASVPTLIGGVLGLSSVNVNAQGTATETSTSGNYYCVIALNQTAQAALQLTGNASITITAPKCVLQVNSKSSSAVTMNGNTTINSTKNCFVGGLQMVGNATITPAPQSCTQIPDPFSAYSRPVVGPCDKDKTNYTLSGGKTVTLQPGVYCGGMSFSGPVNVTFSPGLYVIQDGTVKETGGSFTGNGVTFFLTGQGASLQMSGQANWHIVAPTDNSNGGMPGFAIFLDPNGPTGIAGTSSQLSGQSELPLLRRADQPRRCRSNNGRGTHYARNLSGDQVEFDSAIIRYGAAGGGGTGATHNEGHL
jgi:hypothetical protein